MRLPVAATDHRPDGLTLTYDGEPVLVAFDCSDEDCDCRRWFAGLHSRNATTLAVVCDLPIQLAELREQVQNCLAAAHLVSAGIGPIEPDEMELVISTAVEMVGIGDTFPVGATIARQDDLIYEVKQDIPVFLPTRIDARQDKQEDI